MGRSYIEVVGEENSLGAIVDLRTAVSALLGILTSLDQVGVLVGGHDGRKVCVGRDCCVSPHDHDECVAPCGCAVYDLHCGMMRSFIG